MNRRRISQISMTKDIESQDEPQKFAKESKL